MAPTRRRGRPPHADLLTPAEWRIVHAVQHGMSNAEIARRRGISRDAVKFHLGNALGKLGLGNRAALTGWFAHPGDSALAAAEGSMAGVSLGPIGQISRSVGDIAQSEAWYRDVLGLPHLYTFGDLAFFDCGGVRLFLAQKPAPLPAESILYFRVEDIVATHGELVGRGVAFVAPPHRIHRHADGTEEWMAFFNDPDGRPLAVMAQVRPA